jgi:hypothetical protein
MKPLRARNPSSIRARIRLVTDRRSLQEFDAVLEHLERAMKVFINLLRLAVSALIVAVPISAWSQTSESATSAQSSSAPAAGGSAKPSRHANRALSKRVRAALLKGGVDASNINVIAKGGAVTLAGTVTDPSQSNKAAEIAKSVQGVTSVRNALGQNVPY